MKLEEVQEEVYPNLVWLSTRIPDVPRKIDDRIYTQVGRPVTQALEPIQDHIQGAIE